MTPTRAKAYREVLLGHVEMVYPSAGAAWWWYASTRPDWWTVKFGATPDIRSLNWLKTNGYIEVLAAEWGGHRAKVVVTEKGIDG